MTVRPGSAGCPASTGTAHVVQVGDVVELSGERALVVLSSAGLAVSAVAPFASDAAVAAYAERLGLEPGRFRAVPFQAVGGAVVL